MNHENCQCFFLRNIYFFHIAYFGWKNDGRNTKTDIDTDNRIYFWHKLRKTIYFLMFCDRYMIICFCHPPPFCGEQDLTVWFVVKSTSPLLYYCVPATIYTERAQNIISRWRALDKTTSFLEDGTKGLHYGTNRGSAPQKLPQKVWRINVKVLRSYVNLSLEQFSGLRGPVLGTVYAIYIFMSYS